MRILLLGEGDAETRNAWSGISKSVVDTLRAQGHEVTPVDVDLYGADRAMAAAATFSLVRRRWWVRYHLGGVPFRLRSKRAEAAIAAHRGGVDLILQFGATFSTGSDHGLPVFMYCDGNIALSTHGRGTGQSDASFLRDAEIERIRAREGKVYAAAAAIFAISERVRVSFERDFALPSGKLHTVYAGPNWTLDDALAAERVPQQRERPTVLFIGRQFMRKGGDTLLAAFAQVREELPNARLVIVGPRDLAVRQPGVDVLGFIDKDTPEGAARLHELYCSADCFCMPSRFEGLSIAFMEAMAFGLPCIGAATEWAYPETIVDGETGLVVPVDDPPALAAAMLQLLRDPQRAYTMGQAGRERVRRHFTWERVIGAMSKVIAPMLALRDSRPRE